LKLNKNQILTLLENVTSEEGYMLIDVNLKGNENNPVVEVFVDNVQGVTAEDCEKLSRKFETVLEEKIFSNKKYRLDVSSPGIDRPLKYLLQYTKHIGREFRITFLTEEGKKTFEGKLVEINDDELKFLQKVNEIKIKFGNIIKAKVLISF
jgi:ribosome maturation factor RimP